MTQVTDACRFFEDDSGSYAVPQKPYWFALARRSTGAYAMVLKVPPKPVPVYRMAWCAPQYSSASMMVMTRWVTDGSAGSGECIDML